MSINWMSNTINIATINKNLTTWFRSILRQFTIFKTILRQRKYHSTLTTIFIQNIASCFLCFVLTVVISTYSVLVSKLGTFAVIIRSIENRTTKHQPFGKGLIVMVSVTTVFVARASRVGAVASVRTMFTLSVRVAFTMSITRRFWSMSHIVSAIFASIAPVIVGFSIVFFATVVMIALVGCIMGIDDGI